MSARAAGGWGSGRRLVLLLPAAALAAACAGAPRPLPPLEAGERPWLLPASAFGTQRLFRGSYRGAGGDGAFRATLRLAAADRFDLLLSDPLGRQLASLRVEGGAALLVDHRRRTHCARPEAATLPGVGVLPLRPGELAAVLLGALPAVPDDPAGEIGELLELVDEDGRRWRARIEDGMAVEWSVSEGGGEPWSWRRRGGREATLSTPGGAEVKWQEVVVEPLRSPLPPAAPPPGSVERCDLAGEAEER